jgi:hypothetical protein
LGRHPSLTPLKRLLINPLFFGSILVLLYENRAAMKTLINLIHLIKVVFLPSTFSHEKMPALIPVRVVTKVHPAQHR